MNAAKARQPMAASLAAVYSSVTETVYLPSRPLDFKNALNSSSRVAALMSALAGIAGVAAGVICLLIHLVGLNSLGLPYLKPNRKSMEGGGGLRPLLKLSKSRNENLKPQDGRNQK